MRSIAKYRPAAQGAGAEQLTLAGFPGSHTCTCCGKSLSDPVSIAAGMGPVCRAKGHADNDDGQAGDNPLALEVEIYGYVFNRIDGRPHTNVPRHAVHHSPTGFEWGYGGSGPTDLALCIVQDVLLSLGYHGETTPAYHGQVFAEAFLLHQDFKWEFIARLPQYGGTIPRETARAWVSARLAEEGQA